LPYEECTAPEFAEKAARSFRAVPVPGGVYLAGHCPRCTDAVEFPFVRETYRGARRRGRTAGRPDDRDDVVPMLCTCTGDHPGRPEAEDGCGAYWNLTLRATGS
jgi:hypothetical protein